VQCRLYEPAYSAGLANLPIAVGADVVEPAAEWLEPLLEPLPGAVTGAAARSADEGERRAWRVAPEAEGRFAPAWVVGKLVHETIAGWRFPLDGSFGAWAAARARDFGITDAERLHDAAARARRLLERFQQSPISRTIAAASQRLHEVPYSYLAGGEESESGSIDLLYRVGECWTVIDFKTDRIRTPSEREEIIRAKGYDRQLARYVAAVQALLGVQPEAYLCLLDDGGQVRLWSQDAGDPAAQPPVKSVT
jgi:hypothetical protein